LMYVQLECEKLAGSGGNDMLALAK
jgi:hypothetical protein